MLGNLASHCKRRLGRLSLANDGAAEASKRGTQLGIGDVVEAAVEGLALRRLERPQRRRRRALLRRRSALDEGEADHRAIAEIAVDALEQHRLAVLDLKREGGGDAQPQGAVPPFAAREGQLDRPAMPRQLLADDRRPLGEQLRLAETLLAADRFGDAREAGADRLHAAAPIVQAIAAQPALR